MKSLIKPEQQERLQGTGRIVAMVGAVLMIIAPYLKWAYGADALDDMTYWGGPSILQFLFLALGVIVLVSLIGSLLRNRVAALTRIDWYRAAKAAATGGLVFVIVTILAIALETTPESALRFVVAPLSLTRIDRVAGSWRVRYVNRR